MVYNPVNRWSRRGFRKAVLAALAEAGWSGKASAIDATDVNEHRTTQGGKRGRGAGDWSLTRRPDH